MSKLPQPDAQTPQPHSQPQRDPFVDYKELFKSFMENIEWEHNTSLIEKSTELSDEDYVNFIVKPLTKELGKFTRDILFREPQLFVDSKLKFPSFSVVLNDENISSFDVCEFYNKIPEFARFGFWEYIEQLYVLGNLIIHHSPEKKHKFLELIKTLKHQKHQEDINKMKEHGPQSQHLNQDQGYDQAMQNLNSMFGFEEGHPMQAIFGDITKKVESLVNESSNPMELMTDIMSGNMSKFGGVMDELSASVEKRIENGEINKDEFQNQLQTIAQRVSGGGGGMPGFDMSGILGGMQNPHSQHADPQQAEALQRAQEMTQEFGNMQQKLQTMSPEEQQKYLEEARSKLMQNLNQAPPQSQPQPQPPRPQDSHHHRKSNRKNKNKKK